MDFILLTLLIIFSVFAGVILTLATQFYLFNVYIMKQPYVGPSSATVHAPLSLPKDIIDGVSLGKESAGVNALLQFLFQELRSTKRVRRWFRQRLTQEFEELLTRTTTGKLFEKIVLRDLHLGSHLPAIESIEVKSLKYDPVYKLIDDVELCLDLEYSGGFQLSIDASMRLSKEAHVSVKVNELRGQGRLMFSRTPYTHWSFSFYSDPLVNLSVESQFQGRSLPQVNSIIANQIRKAVKRKHTLPYYKIRYKPFFVRPEPETSEEDSQEPWPGKLEVTLIEATRITETSSSIYCNVAIDSSAWIEMIHSATASYLSVDVSISKQASLSLVVTFKQEFIPDKYQVGIVVENVPNPSTVDLKVGDIVTMVDGKEVTSVSVLNRVIKNGSINHVIRVERRLKTILINDDKLASLDACGLRHRRGSAEKTDSDSSNPPSSSDDGLKLPNAVFGKIKRKRRFRGCSYSPAKRSHKGSPEHLVNRSSLSTEPEIDFSRPQLQSSKDLPHAKVITFNETFKLQVVVEHRYLNLSMWARGEERSQLLGHTSLPIAPYCNPHIVGTRLAHLPLLPPSPNLPNSWSDTLGGLNGFEPSLCYGDVLLGIRFTPAQGFGGAAPPPPVTVTTPTPPPETPPPSPLPVPAVLATHEFVRTHFPKAPQCGFCFKKIWLKDALQCQGCRMTCHKKCAPKCQSGQPCARTMSAGQPEIVTTSPLEAEPPLPTSLVDGCLFPGSGVDEIDQAVSLVMSRPHDDNVMDIAKSTGKLLFADLPPEARKLRIDEVMNKLKDAMDAETKHHQSLLKEDQVDEEISLSESRLQALTILMLHCCAGLQDSQETTLSQS